MLIPLLEQNPEIKLSEMIERLSMSEPFNRYTLFRTDCKWDEDVINYFTTETDQFLCVYDIGYDPSPVLTLAKEKGFKIGSDFVQDAHSLYTSVTTIGVIHHHGT
jgi:hypothetical protein